VRILVIEDDPTDNRILECALAADAELVVTGDKKHLLPLGSFRDVAVRFVATLGIAVPNFLLLTLLLLIPARMWGYAPPFGATNVCLPAALFRRLLPWLAAIGVMFPLGGTSNHWNGLCRELYEADFYVWALAQADLLRTRRFDALDLNNLIEEVEGLADVKRSAVLNNARVIMEHLLKLQHSPATDPRKSRHAAAR
jgi:hypothetical protein